MLRLLRLREAPHVALTPALRKYARRLLQFARPGSNRALFHSPALATPTPALHGQIVGGQGMHKRGLGCHAFRDSRRGLQRVR